MTIGIVGLGAMGLGIAQVFAQAGQSVRATDAMPAARESTMDRLAAALAPRVEKGAMTPSERDAILSRVQVVDRVEDLAPADLVIEAIIEDMAAKRTLLSHLAKALPQAVLATNTSSLSVGMLAQGLPDPGRLIGLHFFNPAPAMKLVELIGHAGSAPDALTVARALTEAAGKTVITAPDRPGFIVNRCARPFYGEAFALLEEGHTATAIDGAMLAAGYRIGPLALIDLIGADINLAATEGLASAMGNHPRYHVFRTLRGQVAAGRLGRKTGQGFIFPATVTPQPDDTIALRIEAALVNEAAWLMAEAGVTGQTPLHPVAPHPHPLPTRGRGGADETVASALPPFGRDTTPPLRASPPPGGEGMGVRGAAGGPVSEIGIDSALKLGLNFPRGPFEILALHGPDTIRATLAACEASAPFHLKGRYLPPPGALT